jgi:serine protease Do
VLKIDADSLTAAPLGDSDKVEVGDWVVAIGNPFGLEQTVTVGVVSAKGRANVGIADYEDFIQTDAAINPGNSGGPLVNLRGEVIGINTAIATRTGSYAGIGFAIPINMARTVMESIIKSGRVVRGWLGVVIQPLDQDLAQSFGYPSTNGALVSDVEPNGPAAKAGIRGGDIIVEFNGRKIESTKELRDAVAATPPGTEVTVRIFRDGKYMNLRVKAGERTAGKARLSWAGGGAAAEELGITVRNLTPELAHRLGYDESDTGVVVVSVQPGSLAQRAGIQAGDLIVRVAGEPIKDVNDFERAMAKHDLAKGIRMLVKSGGFLRYVFLRASK